VTANSQRHHGFGQTPAAGTSAHSSFVSPPEPPFAVTAWGNHCDGKGLQLRRVAGFAKRTLSDRVPEKGGGFLRGWLKGFGG